MLDNNITGRTTHNSVTQVYTVEQAQYTKDMNIRPRTKRQKRRKWSQNERMVNREVKKRQEQPSNKKTEKKTRERLREQTRGERESLKNNPDEK